MIANITQLIPGEYSRLSNRSAQLFSPFVQAQKNVGLVTSEKHIPAFIYNGSDALDSVVGISKNTDAEGIETDITTPQNIPARSSRQVIISVGGDGPTPYHAVITLISSSGLSPTITIDGSRIGVIRPVDVEFGIPTIGTPSAAIISLFEVAGGSVNIGRPFIVAPSLINKIPALTLNGITIGLPLMRIFSIELPVKPSEINNLEAECKTEIIEYENGYEQRFKLMHKSRKRFVFRWNAISKAERTSLQEFFNDQLGMLRSWDFEDSRLNGSFQFRFDSDSIMFESIKHKAFNAEIKVITVN